MTQTKQTGKVVNISGYKFVALSDLEAKQKELRDRCVSLQLKGTILLSEEGINCFLAGNREGIDSFLSHLTSYEELSDFEAKESFNDYQPFSRMLVKIKPEIITFDMPEVKPAARMAQKVSPVELQSWLDDEEEVVLLDTRNDYEIELGTFDRAESVNIDNFREFPEAIKSLPEEYKNKKIVMFCTGGIRCEKAGPFMEDAGFEDVWQLDGGILKYFEKCGGAHWNGECFVFDKRVALDPELSETATTLCYVCQAVLGEKDQSQPTYQFGVSCPYCFQEESESGPVVLDCQTRTQKIADVASPLPGSVPYENFRPMSVAKNMEGMSLLEFLNALKTHLSESDWISCIEAGQILHKGKPVGMDRNVMHGQKYYHLMPDTTEPDVSTDVEVLFESEDFVVINKPAPIPMHPCGRFNRNSLQFLLQKVYDPDRLRLVHRLDANTTGLVVYARTKLLATRLIEQFGQGRIVKEYLALVHGQPDQEFESEVRIAAQPGDNGIRYPDGDGQFAQTKFETKAFYSSTNQSLVKAVPLTGRTNQIRIHLWEAGFPIVGDPTYLQDGQVGINQTLSISAPPMCLHSRRLKFVHPFTREHIEFEAPQPEWLSSLPEAE